MPMLYSGETSEQRWRGHGSLSMNGELQCRQTHQLMSAWLRRQNIERQWKTNGKGAYFFKGVCHRSSGFPSCPGSYWAVAVHTVLGHFLHNIYPLQRSSVWQAEWNENTKASKKNRKPVKLNGESDNLVVERSMFKLWIVLINLVETWETRSQRTCKLLTNDPTGMIAGPISVILKRLQSQ